MSDDKSKRDGRDRSRVAGDEAYEVEYFAKDAGIAPAQVRELIKQHGNSRETLLAAAKDIKSGTATA